LTWKLYGSKPVHDIGVMMGEERKVYKVLVGKPEGKRPLGRQGVGGRMGSE
jgi:hypothetical protein